MGKKNLDLFASETEDFEEVEMLEENLSIESLEFQNPNLVRVDMNMIEYPLFSKNNHRKKNQAVKYLFNNNRNNYIKVEPTVGDYIPGDFEEKVFIGLLKIMKKKEFAQSFYVTSSEILDELGLQNKIYYKKVKQAILRLSKTSYEFKNTLYANKINNTLDETISTKMLDIRIIELSKDKKVKEIYNDNRIKEVYEINISKYFYENIIRKGYMVYDANILLEIESSISRTIYMLVNKVRFTNLYIKLPVIYLIKRIPLKLDDKNISRTVKVLEKSCKELRESGLIEEFNVIKNKNWKTAEIEFIFNEKHNEIKQLQFFDDKNHFENILGKIDENLVISHTVEETLPMLHQLKAEHSQKEPSEEDIESILNILPKKAKTLKTMPNTIKKAIQKYGYSHIVDVSEYIKDQNPKSISGYFTKALENNWAEDFIRNKKAKEEKSHEIPEEKPIVIFEAEKTAAEIEKEKIRERYSQLPETEKLEIENLAYEDYTSQYKGMGNSKKIMEIAFKNGKVSIICDYLRKREYFKAKPEKIEIEEAIVSEVQTENHQNRDETINKKEIVNREEIINREEIRKVINEEVGAFAFIEDLDGKKERDLKVEIVKLILAEKNPTLSFLRETIEKKIEIFRMEK